MLRWVDVSYAVHHVVVLDQLSCIYPCTGTGLPGYDNDTPCTLVDTSHRTFATQRDMS